MCTKFDGTLEFDDGDIVWVILRVITFVHFIRCYIEELLVRRIGKIVCTFKRDIKEQKLLDFLCNNGTLCFKYE